MSKKVLLVAMPWVAQTTPSIQIATLASYLRLNGIEVEIKNFYLELANLLGIKEYDTIASKAYWGEIVYAPLLFNDLNLLNYNYKIIELLLERFGSMDALYQKIEEFHAKILAEVQKSNFDIVGFTLTYSQTNSSLLLAKKIKEINPDVKVVFGGGCCYGELGKSIKEKFDYLDFVISGVGEEPLLQLVKRIRNNEETYEDIPGLIYSKDGVIHFNEESINLEVFDSLPFADFDDYFLRLSRCKNLNIANQVYIPIQGSRGCWWGKCSFCGLNNDCVGTKFHHKPVEKIVEEIDYQTEKYLILNVALVDSVHYAIEELSQSVAGLGKDITLFMECHPTVKPKQLADMARAGFEIQVGIESFSSSILKKMNKGTTAIQNIQTLKWAKMCGLKVSYNIITHFPMETAADISAMLENMRYITHLTPPSISPFSLNYQSQIHQHPTEHNIKDVVQHQLNQSIFPQNILEGMEVLLYDYKTITDPHTAELWKEFDEFLVDWTDNPRQLVYMDGVTFLKIIDKTTEGTLFHTLNGEGRNLYLYCSTIKSFAEIAAKFAHIDPEQIKNLLDNLVSMKLVFQEGDRYLSLALPGRQKLDRLLCHLGLQ